ncbi:AAA family ATPase [Endozoicomonas sp. 8E]|uniref:AAA family ATPase n=1 Tax=Endozoicomonas sp. 8E TaxID=3035692 RepID=UPI002938D4D9|nr:AAA family ATPase [Endozoicomonas sp. 8E]WOG28820.1 AAA family ATPase [Endozoicomonas sp. 8E]
MDGSIGVEKNDLVPERGVPVRKANRDSPSKIAEICPGITPKLNRSSGPMTSTDKARTVSSKASSLQKAPHAFDFRFVASDDEVRRLLVTQTCDEHRDVTLIAHPDDLSQANLVSRLSIFDDGRHVLGSGKLFEGYQPLTLVIDIRKLTSEDLPKFNDLLDPANPCLYDKVSQKKRPLGEHVALLVVADPGQLALAGQRDDASGADAPGADFWRRINRPGNTWQFDAKNGNDPSMKLDKVPPVLTELPCSESTMDANNTVLIDCHLHSHWRQLLLGGPGVDQQGRIRHIAGRLESLRAGHRVILKGANWDDLAFEQTIRQMLAQQFFESNGKRCQLPDDIQFYRMPVGNSELYSLFQSLCHSSNKEGDKGLDKDQAPGNPIIINHCNIREWLSPIAITPEGYAVPNTCLFEQVRTGGAVTVTSPLTEAHWFRLLGSLQTIRETTGLKPHLQVAHSRRQPKALGLAENHEQSLFKSHQLQKNVRDHTAAFNAVTYQQHVEASYWINNQQEAPLVIRVSEQTGFSQLFDNIHIRSEQKAHFGRSQSALQKALTAGKPVVFLGLESNPTLQQLLEPLIVGEPLLVNGQLQAYPQAHVTILWPRSATSRSSIVNSMVDMGNPCPEVGVWDINVLRHGIPRAELPEQALCSVYKAFETVPADLCKPLPEMTEGLLNNLILAARQAQQVDQSPQLRPCHWRKAINSVVTHGTRRYPPVRDFMKVACWLLLPDKTPDAHNSPDEGQAASVDPDRLTAIINSALWVDRGFVIRNLWQLARAFDVGLFNEELKLSYESPFPEFGAEEFLDRLCAMIAAHAPEKRRDAIAYQLQVDLESIKPYSLLAIRPSRQIKRLQDALACGWQLPLPSGQTRSDAIHALATDCFHRARAANSEAEGIERIEHRLAESLKWQGSASMPLSALARDLYHGLMSQKDRESRRLSRLHDRLSDSPVIFLQGETGTGKSYFSAKMAKASGQASVISLGPSDSEQTLMKRWQWQQHADGDRSMVQQNRALMEWANTKSDKDGEYISLVLDEANLARTGLLASLNGLWEPKPCVYVNGHPVKVGPKHRVILTGNGDHYAGRQMDPTLKEKLPRVYFPRLDQAFLRDRVVEPALVRHLQEHLMEHQISDYAHRTTNSVMALGQYYQELLPGHEFTPRDLTDICSWVGWYLDRALPARGSVTCEQINSLIQQSFRDVLGPEITETHQDALSALEIWFAARYQSENTLSDRVRNKILQDMQRTFSTVTEKIRPDFDTSGSAVRELAQQLGQDLNRCQQAYHLKRKHGGRQATLIEGPAGRGKDATLNLVIESVRQEAKRRGESMPEVFLLNACDCSWEKLCEKILKAKVDGGIVVISEMNLIDSQHLEGELNDILAGDAHPGFHLFATINPPEYSGRKPLSPALKGRFRYLPIRQYNTAELQTIAGKVLPESLEGTFVAKKLTEKHCLLRAYLQQKNLPLQPTGLDLQNVAKAVMRGNDFTEKALYQCLTQHYRLYLMAADLSLEKLPEPPALIIAKGEPASELCSWFNQTVKGINRPWLIRNCDHKSIDEERYEIGIEASLNEAEAKTEIIRMVAQAKWLASGFSLEPNESDDILTRALYRHWQHSWFDREFGRTGVKANLIFPLTKEEEQTLKMPACQPYLREADKQIEAWKADEVQWWPAFWHQISNLPNCWMDDSEKYNPEVLEKEARALDQRTNYECQEKLKVDVYEVFETRYHSAAMYRWRAVDTYVTAEGNIKQISLDDIHILGVEPLIPARLPGPDQEVALTSKQTLATFNGSSKNGQFALPSLTPNDHIVALRIEPDLPYTLIRDRYNGLHTLSVSKINAEQGIQFAYIVEPREAGRKEARPERSTWLDTHCSEGMITVLDELFKSIEQQPLEIQEPLRSIKNAEDTGQRIEAITEYCRQFSGASQPESAKNFFKFLVTQRQGSCRHRVPVFVAFCRYFGIPCRQINNRIHCFAEYSVDERQTWESVDLGGAPIRPKAITPQFQLTKKVLSASTASKKIKNLLKGADLAQQQTFAAASGMSLEELKKTLETDNALPESNPDIPELFNNLFKEKSLSAFSMGVSVIESLGREELDHYDLKFKPISEAAIQILSDSDEDQVSEQLKSLYSKTILQAGIPRYKWLTSMVYLLKETNLTKPSVLQLARKAMASGWLDPVPDYDSQIMGADIHHDLLVHLEGIDELKVSATHCLKKLYKQLFSLKKNSQKWRTAYKRYQEKNGNALSITHCYEGFSAFLEDKILSSSLQNAWTDEPEGIPNIERMLVHHPAFVKLTSGKANHRPVIIMGQPHWRDTVISEKIDALYQRIINNSPYLKPLLEEIRLNPHGVSWEDQSLLDDIKTKSKSMIEQAFIQYLHSVTHSKGGCLTYCWGDALFGERDDKRHYGAHDPSSPAELLVMMCNIHSSLTFQNSVKDAYLRQALNASNALILRSGELTTIGEEFLNSVNLNSLCESLDTL